MKRNFILALIFGSMAASTYAQGEMDAFNLSYPELTGTARSAAMGGAMGALGGNISAISINPAGIGVYKSSEVVTTLSFANAKTKAELNGLKTDGSKFKFDLSNIGFVGTFPIQSDVAPLINFGFSYNNLRSFNRKVSMRGNNLKSSLTDNIADRANYNGKDATINGGYNEIGNDWLAMLGYDAGVIGYSDKNQRFETILNSGETVNNNLYMREKGYVNSYDFNVGTTFANMLSFGISVAVTDIDYRLYSDYSEDFSDGGGTFLENEMKTEGTGWQIKAGLIFKPINELRIGVAYHSPTWYDMTDYYRAYMGMPNNSGSWNTVNTPTDAFTDYKLRTPDKWVFSLAGLIGKTATITADYELTNYGNMHLSDRDGFAYSYDNQKIKNDFRNSSTLRVGAEVYLTEGLTARVGYMWQQSPVKDILKDGSDNAYLLDNYDKVFFDATAGTVGTIPQYTLVGDANYFTYGLGYTFNNGFYTDLAFIMMNRKDDLYTYAGSERTELKNNKYTGLLTLGFRF